MRQEKRQSHGQWLYKQPKLYIRQTWFPMLHLGKRSAIHAGLSVSALVYFCSFKYTPIYLHRAVLIFMLIVSINFTSWTKIRSVQAARMHCEPISHLRMCCCHVFGDCCCVVCVLAQFGGRQQRSKKIKICISWLPLVNPVVSLL